MQRTNLPAVGNTNIKCLIREDKSDSQEKGTHEERATRSARIKRSVAKIFFSSLLISAMLVPKVAAATDSNYQQFEDNVPSASQIFVPNLENISTRFSLIRKDMAELDKKLQLSTPKIQAIKPDIMDSFILNTNDFLINKLIKYSGNKPSFKDSLVAIRFNKTNLVYSASDTTSMYLGELGGLINTTGQDQRLNLKPGLLTSFAPVTVYGLRASCGFDDLALAAEITNGSSTIVNRFLPTTIGGYSSYNLGEGVGLSMNGMLEPISISRVGVTNRFWIINPTISWESGSGIFQITTDSIFSNRSQASNFGSSASQKGAGAWFVFNPKWFRFAMRIEGIRDLNDNNGYQNTLSATTAFIMPLKTFGFPADFRVQYNHANSTTRMFQNWKESYSYDQNALKLGISFSF